jgi:acyl-CoA reductase-like NAD-dependent aldehyde dehydrogenase
MNTALYLAGQFIETTQKIKVVNPYNQLLIAEVSAADENIMLQAIASAVHAKKSFATFSSLDVSQALLVISNGIALKKEEFIATIVAESGKPYKYASGEVLRAIETFRMAAFEATRLPHELITLDDAATGKGLMGRIQYRSAGIVAGISPFNFPLNLVAHKIAPAIATKSPIILKPSSKTPMTALLLAEVIDGAGLPKGALSVLPCSRAVGDILVQHEDIQVLSFTGSPEIGWDMKNRAGKKKVVLELGGNAAALVLSDANLDHAVNQLVVGAFAYSGQVCIHTQRIYVHASIFEKFLEKFIAQTKNMNIGSPENLETDFSCMIDETNALRIEQWLSEAKNTGAEIRFGGTRKSNFFDPTIVCNTQKGIRIYDEEVFGPVVCINPYDDINEAIEQVNNSRFGLHAAIFTEHQPSIELCYAELEVGGLIVNRSTTFRTDQMPYGGVKDSGFGREGIRYAMMDYLEGKVLVF